MEKEQRNSINKKQNGLKYSKNDKSSTLPRQPNYIWAYCSPGVATPRKRARFFFKLIKWFERPLPEQSL